LKECGVESIEKLFGKIHNEIKKNPDFSKREVRKDPKRDHAAKKCRRLNAKQRKEKVQKKFEIAMASK